MRRVTLQNMLLLVNRERNSVAHATNTTEENLMKRLMVVPTVVMALGLAAMPASAAPGPGPCPPPGQGISVHAKAPGVSTVEAIQDLTFGLYKTPGQAVSENCAPAKP